MNRKLSNIISCIIIAICAFFLIKSFSIKIDGIYPRILCITGIIFSVFSIAQTELNARAAAKEETTEIPEDELSTEELAEKLAHEKEEPARWQDIVLVIAVALCSAILWKYISFLFASILAILAISLVKKQPLVRSILVAVITALVLQLIFKNIFQIPVPSPSWWPYF